MKKGTGPLIVAGIGLVTLLVAAVIVVVGADSVADLDPGSPEGVVQSYVQAVAEGDDEAALALLDDPDDHCVGADPDEFRMTLADVTVTDDEAEIEVVITRGGGEPPFDGYSYSSEEIFELHRNAEGWTITNVPWQFQTCEEPS